MVGIASAERVKADSLVVDVKATGTGVAITNVANGVSGGIPRSVVVSSTARVTFVTGGSD